MKTVGLLRRGLFLAVFCSIFLFSQTEVPRETVLGDEFWKLEYEQFIPDRFLMESLDQRITEPLQIDVYLGFWCDDSKTQVPRFLRIIDLLEGRSQITLRIYDVGGRKKAGQKYYVESLAIEKIPTFIIKRQGAELGRIVETPNASLLEDILTLLM